MPTKQETTIDLENIKIETEVSIEDVEDSKTMVIELQHSNGLVLNSRLQAQPSQRTVAGESAGGSYLGV